MRKKVDAVTRILEDWAAWRLGYELYDGTGASPLVRFQEPGHPAVFRSRPLWDGFIRSELSCFHSRLVVAFTDNQLNILMIIFGTTERLWHKIMRHMEFDRTDRTLRRLQAQARDIAIGYLYPHQHSYRNSYEDYAFGISA